MILKWSSFVKACENNEDFIENIDFETTILNITNSAIPYSIKGKYYTSFKNEKLLKISRSYFITNIINIFQSVA